MATKKRLRRYYFQNRIWPVSLHVLVGDYRDAKRWVNHRFPDKGGESWKEETEAGSAVSSVLAQDRPGLPRWECVIWLTTFRRGNSFDAGLLAHESLHVVWRLLEKVGCYDEEAHCYMQQWIVEEVTDALTT